MATLKSKWRKPATLHYTATKEEIKKKETTYRWWLASVRGWSLDHVDLYLTHQRAWVAMHN